MGIKAAAIPQARIASWGQGENITPSDVTVFSTPYDAIICKGNAGLIGNVKVDLAEGGGTAVVIPVTWGIPFVGLVTRVYSTDTDADSVTGLRYGSPA